MIDRRRLCGGVLALGAAVAATPGRAASPPRRVVALDYGLTELLLALGTPPIALPDAHDWARWEVEPPLPVSVHNLGSDKEINLELLASLKPDLILTTPYLDALTPILQRIAPCERLAIFEDGGDGPLARAEIAMRRLGVLLGVPERAEGYLAATRAQFAADRAALATGPRAPLLLVTFLDARHVWVYGTKSLWQDVLDRLDQSNAWSRPTTYWGFSAIGIEELVAAAADAILVALEPIPADALATLEGSPLWRNLPFVRAGRVRRLPPALVFGALSSARRFSRLLTATLTGVPVP